MSYKRTTTAFLAASLAVLSCSKEGGPAARSGDVSGNPAEGAPADVTVVLEGVAGGTRCTWATDRTESTVNDLQIYVFDGDRLDGYGHATGKTSCGVSCSSGTRDVYVLVNAPTVTDETVATKKDLFSLEQTLDGREASGVYLNANADNFVMYGKSEGCTVGVSATVVPVKVRRYASRVIIEKITRGMEDARLRELPADRFRVTRIYLADVRSNALTDSAAVSSPETKLWLNAPFSGSGKMTAGFPLLCDAPDAALADGASYTKEHRFYAYPNSDVTTSPWGKTTRLVVELNIDGKYYTYPIEIADGVRGMRANSSYRIGELVLAHLGNPSNGDDVVDSGEDDPVALVTLGCTVEVGEWDVVPITSEGQKPGTVVI